MTPTDKFDDGGINPGRITGEHCVTTSNGFKAFGAHGVVIYENHNPYDEPSVDAILDRFAVADRYIRAAAEWQPDLRFPSFFQKTGDRSGGSQVHGHGQIGVGKRFHLGFAEGTRARAEVFKSEGGNYLQSLIAAHNVVGLGFEKQGVTVLPMITPPKANGVMLIAPNFHSQDQREVVAETVRTYRRDIALAYNIVVTYPPLTAEGRFPEGFPTIMTLVDRGDPTKKTSDFGALEAAGGTIILDHDPYRLHRILAAGLGVSSFAAAA